MAGLMEGHPAFDLAYFRNPFQVDVRLAATVHREQPAFFGDAAVFVDKFKRQFQQRYVKRCPGLLTCAVNPPCAVLRLCEVLYRQVRRSLNEMPVNAENRNTSRTRFRLDLGSGVVIIRFSSFSDKNLGQWYIVKRIANKRVLPQIAAVDG